MDIFLHRFIVDGGIRVASKAPTLDEAVKKVTELFRPDRLEHVESIFSHIAGEIMPSRIAKAPKPYVAPLSAEDSMKKLMTDRMLGMFA